MSARKKCPKICRVPQKIDSLFLCRYFQGKYLGHHPKGNCMGGKEGQRVDCRPEYIKHMREEVVTLRVYAKWCIVQCETQRQTWKFCTRNVLMCLPDLKALCSKMSYLNLTQTIFADLELEFRPLLVLNPKKWEFIEHHLVHFIWSVWVEKENYWKNGKRIYAPRSTHTSAHTHWVFFNFIRSQYENHNQIGCWPPPSQ